MNLYFISVLIVFAGGLSAILLCRQFLAMKVISVAGIAVGCGLGLFDAISRLGGAPVEASFQYLSSISLSFRIDNLSAFFLVVIFLISLMATIYSYHYMYETDRGLRTAANYLFFSLLIIAMALVVTANNVLAFLLAWEMMSLSSFFLVVYDFESPSNRKAGYLYLVYSHIGVMFIFAAFGLLAGHTGSGLGETFDPQWATAAVPDSIKILVFVLAFVGFGSKAGVFPFHCWLPHAHPAAPSHISALMSGVMIKIGVYGILRMYGLLQVDSAVLGEIVLIAGIVSGIIGIVYALGQQDIKRLLAYCSVENVGIILVGLGLGMIGVASGKPIMAALGFCGGLLHVLNHSLFKSLLFMGAGAVLQKSGTRSMDALGGLLKKMRVTGVTFLIGSIAICGLPPFNGFVSELLVYLGGFNGTALSRFDFVLSIAAIVGLAVIGGLALACFTKLVGVAFQGEPRTQVAQQVTVDAGVTMLAPMVVLAAICVAIGVFPKTFVLAALGAASTLGVEATEAVIEPFVSTAENITFAMALFFAILVLIFAVRALAFRSKKVTSSGTWGCGFTQPTVKMQYTSSSYAFSILELFRPVAPLREEHSPIEGRFPQRTHYNSHLGDVAEIQVGNLIVRPIQWLFDKLRWIQHGNVHLYIGYILLTVIVLLFFV